VFYVNESATEMQNCKPASHAFKERKHLPIASERVKVPWASARGERAHSSVDVPPNYVQINSGLEKSPSNIVVLPVLLRIR
jgi:hypothetical protein